MICFGCGKDDCNQNKSGPYQGDVVCPSPVKVEIDEPTEDRSDRWSNKGRQRDEYHWLLNVIRVEDISDRASCDGEKRAPSEPVEETSHCECLHILCDS